MASSEQGTRVDETKALTVEERRFRRFIDAHDVETVDGFWWCEGRVWEARDYRVALLGKAGPQREVVEVRGADPAELAAAITALGLEAPSVEEIAKRCESAPRSPRLPRRARASSPSRSL